MRDLAETVGLNQQARLVVRRGRCNDDLNHAVETQGVDDVEGVALDERRLAKHDRLRFGEAEGRRAHDA